MIYKRVIDENWKAPDGTGFNDFPLGWREVSVSEYAQWGQTYSPTHYESRQMMYEVLPDLKTRHKTKELVSATLEWHKDGTGWAIVTDYWKETIKFYRFGCDHDYKELSVDDADKRGIYHARRCYHVVECKKCGHVMSYDSSD